MMKGRTLAGACAASAALVVLYGFIAGCGAVAGEQYSCRPDGVVVVSPAPDGGVVVSNPPVRVCPDGRRRYNPYAQRDYKDNLPGLVDAINRDYPPFGGGRPGGWR
jgi:hypothetical protein